MGILNLKKNKQQAQVEEGNFFLIGDNTPFNIREAFNTLRTNVVFALAPTGGKRLMITSSNASEGKSTTAVNLAV